MHVTDAPSWKHILLKSEVEGPVLSWWNWVLRHPTSNTSVRLDWSLQEAARCRVN